MTRGSAVNSAQQIIRQSPARPARAVYLWDGYLHARVLDRHSALQDSVVALQVCQLAPHRRRLIRFGRLRKEAAILQISNATADSYGCQSKQQIAANTSARAE